MTARHQHKFERLSDEAIFCACGEIRLAPPEARCARPHYEPTWIWYPPVYQPPTYPWWGTETTPVITYTTTGGTTS